MRGLARHSFCGLGALAVCFWACAGPGSAAPALPATAASRAAARASAFAPHRLRVMIDPGHGGRPENPGPTGGDAWDCREGRFLRVVNFGGAARSGRGATLTEHELVLGFSRRVERLLDLTRTDAGWARFEAMLRGLGARGDLPRVYFETRLTRTDDYRARVARGDVDPNRDFRLLDSPARFPAENGTPLHPGRVSQIVDWAPDLAIVLHVNDGPGSRPRGMNALFVPSPGAYEALRQTALTRRPFTPELDKLAACWIARGRSRSTRESMLESAWNYFTGFAPAADGRSADPARPDGEPWTHVTWAFRGGLQSAPRTSLATRFDGPFWERERSAGEERRRAGGHEGFGGDNLYAGQELLRHVRMALWKDHLASQRQPPPEVFGRGQLSVRDYIGALDRPLCASWTLPLYVNSVTAYLEMGYLSNPRDRWLQLERPDQFAEGLAAGIYSLAVGLRLTPLPGMALPAGIPIKWRAYGDHVKRARWTAPSPPVVERLGTARHTAAAQSGSGAARTLRLPVRRRSRR